MPIYRARFNLYEPTALVQIKDDPVDWIEFVTLHLADILMGKIHVLLEMAGFQDERLRYPLGRYYGL
jgi:hypothetical protein